MVAGILSLCALLGSLPTEQEDPNSRRYFLSALNSYQQLNYERALLQATKAVAIATNSVDESQAQLLRGIIYAEKGKTPEARRAFEAGFRLRQDATLPTVVSPKITALAERARQSAKELPPPIERTKPTATPSKRQEEDPKSCASAPGLDKEIWSKERQQAVVQRLAKSSVPELSASATDIARKLDAWAKDWEDEQLSICIGENVLRKTTSADAQRRRQCLDSQTGAFAALAKALLVDEGVSSKAVDATKSLPSPSDCALAQVQQTSGNQPTDLEFQQLHNRAIALLETGQLAELEAVLPKLAELGSHAKPVFKAEAMLWTGILHKESGRTQEAINALKKAVAQFLETHTPRRAISALQLLFFIQGTAGNDFRGARENYVLAQRLAGREEDAELLRAKLDTRWGPVLGTARKMEQAARVLEKSVRVLEKWSDRANVYNDLSIGVHNLGAATQRPEAAIPVFAREVEILIKSAGPNHFGLIDAWGNLANVEMEIGNFADATLHAQNAIALSDKLRWPRGKAFAFKVAAYLYSLDDKHQEAARTLQHAIQWDEKVYSPQHPSLARDWMLLGTFSRFAGEFKQAIGLHERALLVGISIRQPQIEAKAQLELALDHLAADEWTQIPDLARSCIEATRRKLFDVDDVLWCELVQARLAKHEGKVTEARTILTKLSASTRKLRGMEAMLYELPKKAARLELAALE